MQFVTYHLRLLRTTPTGIYIIKAFVCMYPSLIHRLSPCMHIVSKQSSKVICCTLAGRGWGQGYNYVSIVMRPSLTTHETFFRADLWWGIDAPSYCLLSIFSCWSIIRSSGLKVVPIQLSQLNLSRHPPHQALVKHTVGHDALFSHSVPPTAAAVQPPVTTQPLEPISGTLTKFVKSSQTSTSFSLQNHSHWTSMLHINKVVRVI